MTNFLENQYARGLFNEHLKNLVSLRSVYFDEDGIRRALEYCQITLQQNLPDRHTYFDSAENLISYSNSFDPNRNAVFLSAHVDTVDADAAEWRSVNDPFSAVETRTHIIGRGANDCKAGVALMLTSCHLSETIPLENVILMFSFREEGNQAKTSVQIGADLGYSIPLSHHENAVLCLENTIKIAPDRYFIDIYDREPCNVFIEMRGTLPDVRGFLSENPEWKPVFVSPIGDHPNIDTGLSLSGTSGHVATLKNSENVLYAALMDDNSGYLYGGDEVQTSVVANRVKVLSGSSSGPHRTILNFRGLSTVEQVQRQLSRTEYREYYPFFYSAGSDRRESLDYSRIKRVIEGLSSQKLSPRFMSNPGRSDASAIWNATNKKEKICIITMGPGTRSHTDNGVARKTHGPDEGFHKESGYIACQYICDVVNHTICGES